MFCSKCGTQLADDAKFCNACGNRLNVIESEVSTVDQNIKPKKKRSKKIRVFLILVVFVLSALSIFHLYQYRGYETFVAEYFEAMESGDKEKILELYSWEYVEAENERTIKEYSSVPGLKDPAMFTSDSLEDYVYNHDKYYRFLRGKEIKSWEITEINKDYLSLLTPKMKIIIEADIKGEDEEVIVTLKMERGSDGWYMTDCHAIYESYYEDD